MDLRDGLVGVDWIDILYLKIETVSCECGNEPSGFIKCGDLLE
jgi:hypothetical protein